MGMNVTAQVLPLRKKMAKRCEADSGDLESLSAADLVRLLEGLGAIDLTSKAPARLPPFLRPFSYLRFRKCQSKLSSRRSPEMLTTVLRCFRSKSRPWNRKCENRKYGNRKYEGAQDGGRSSRRLRRRAVDAEAPGTGGAGPGGTTCLLV